MGRVVLSGAGPSTKPAAAAAAEAAWPGKEGSGRRGSATPPPVTMNSISLPFFSRHLVLTYVFLIAGHQAIRTMALPQHYKFLTSRPPLLKPLRQHCLGLQVVLRFTPAGALPSPPPTSQLPVHTLLAEPAQKVSRGILEILDKLMEDGMYLSHITPEMFAMDQMSGVIKLTQTGERAIIELCPYSYHQVDQNCKEIADLIEDCLFKQNGIDVEQVVEVAYGLLPMLRQGGSLMWYAILNHSSLVPLLNRLELFVRLYRQITNIVQVRCPMEYLAIMNNIIFPEDWHNIIEQNSWMLHFYRGGVYNSKETSRVKQAKLFKDYLRNSETHGMERADGKIGRIDLAQIHHALSPLTLHSMQEGLQTYGWLKSTDLDTLFKYRL